MRLIERDILWQYDIKGQTNWTSSSTTYQQIKISKGRNLRFVNVEYVMMEVPSLRDPRPPFCAGLPNRSDDFLPSDDFFFIQLYGTRNFGEKSLGSTLLGVPAGTKITPTKIITPTESRCLLDDEA